MNTNVVRTKRKRLLEGTNRGTRPHIHVIFRTQDNEHTIMSQHPTEHVCRECGDTKAAVWIHLMLDSTVSCEKHHLVDLQFLNPSECLLVGIQHRKLEVANQIVD